MKIADVVNQLAKVIPQETGFFSDTIGIASILGNGTIVTVNTLAPHNLITGAPVNVRNVKVSNPLASIVFSTVLGKSQLKIVTTNEHDLTLHPSEKGTKFAELIGFTDLDWNANLELIEVSNRKTFTVVNGTASAPVFNSTEQLLQVVFGEINGPQSITVISPISFSYPSTFNLIGNPNQGDVQANIRIAGLVDFRRAVDQYADQPVDRFFMFVLAPLAVTANKSRGSQTDANDEQTQQTNLNQNIRDGFIITVFANVSNEAGALRTMDIIRDDLFKPILLAVRGVKFPSGLECDSNQIANFISHGKLLYNNPLYVHQFIFE